MSDFINREVLIERFKQLKGSDALANMFIYDVVKEVKKQPTVEVPQWIPCSERLPNKDEYLKNDGRFIVTDGNRVYQSIYDIYSAHCFRTLVLFDFGSRSNFEVDNCVIAWMPLPHPYKAVQI